MTILHSENRETAFDTAMKYFNVQIHQWVTAIAQHNPEAIAIEWQEPCLMSSLHKPQQHLSSKIDNQSSQSTRQAFQWSYSQLEQRVNHLANVLSQQQVKPQSNIVILSNHAPSVIVAILATLKLGAIFVPIDSTQPNKRINTLLEQVNPHYILTRWKDYSSIKNVSDIEKLPLCSLDEDSITLNEWKKNTPNTLSAFEIKPWLSTFQSFNSSPESPCYIYFTSGTTQQPKGILGKLKSISHYIHWELNQLKPQKPLRVSQLTSPSFDAFLRDIFVPLCSAGTICIPLDRRIILDAEQLISWIDQQHIQVLHTVPSLFSTVVQHLHLKPQPFTALTHIFLAGEPLLNHCIKKWMDMFGQRIKIYNLYGPSETTMIKFFHEITLHDICQTVHQTMNQDTFQSTNQTVYQSMYESMHKTMYKTMYKTTSQTIPIGKPIKGAAALILDSNLQICAPGEIGEIYIRTPYSSLGYYQQPDLTNKVFIQNPFSQKKEDLIYKTGDLAKLQDNGEYLFMGRKDQQVKIRGIRIDLAEIENQLLHHSKIQQAACQVHCFLDNHENQQSIIYAYVVVIPPLETTQIKDYLTQYFPAVMIPTDIIILDLLPRTITGKLDRNALPLPEPNVQSTHNTAPVTPIEQYLINLWKQILNQQPAINRHNNFFQIGGHSLLAMSALSQINHHFDLAVPISVLFDKPVLCELAEHLSLLCSAKQAIDQDMTEMDEEQI